MVIELSSLSFHLVNYFSVIVLIEFVNEHIIFLNQGTEITCFRSSNIICLFEDHSCSVAQTLFELVILMSQLG